MIDATTYLKEKQLIGKADLLLQIHDELIFEIDSDISEDVANDLTKILENVLKKRSLSDIPLVVSKSLGKNLEVI
jgi:DNA polymerase-1